MSKEKTSWSTGNYIALIILAAILIFGGTLIGASVSQKQAQKGVAGTENISFQPVVEKTISYDGQDGKTALELLKASHEVKTEESPVGVFINSIDGIENQSDKYWMFYVNDELAPVSPDQYQTKTADKIEWRYEKLQ